MRGPRAAGPLLAILLAGTGCRAGQGQAAVPADSVEVARRESRLALALAQPDSGAAPGVVLARWVLGGDLSEISGMAITADGRVLAHGDEEGTISEIDYRRGLVVKRFTLGKQRVHADFEGITVAGDVVFLLASNARLFEFREGANGEHVAYVVHDTGLRHECEFEGIAFDPSLNILLLACKNVRTKGALRDSLVIYRWNLPDGGSGSPSRLTVPLARVIGSNKWKGLHPSDITIDPASGNYVLVAAEERALIEITPAGALVFARPLPESLQHTEGVAITADSLLILSDEAGRRPAEISLYHWR
jgi:uncharacterized protein YjiK